MPVLDGFEATRQIRISPGLKHMIVIEISASVFDFDRAQSIKVGCNGFLSKPVREDELLEKLRLYLGLEWVYEHNHNETREQGHTSPTSQLSNPPILHFPILPEKEIAALLALAMRGDLRAIVKRATPIALARQWEPQKAHLRQLNTVRLTETVTLKGTAIQTKPDESRLVSLFSPR